MGTVIVRQEDDTIACQGVCDEWIHVTVSKWHKWNHFPTFLLFQSLWYFRELTLLHLKTAVEHLVPSVSILNEKYSVHNNNLLNAADCNHFKIQPRIFPY